MPPLRTYASRNLLAVGGLVADADHIHDNGRQYALLGQGFLHRVPLFDFIGRLIERRLDDDVLVLGSGGRRLARRVHPRVLPSGLVVDFHPVLDRAVHGNEDLPRFAAKAGDRLTVQLGRQGAVVGRPVWQGEDEHAGLGL